MDCHNSCPSLPSSLFDLYLRYKRGTRAIVAWLSSHGGADFKAQQHYSIRDLQAFAQIACQQAEPVPDFVAFHFKETIRARRRLSQYFRKTAGTADTETGADTENHEFFTASLTEIYATLCQCNGSSHENSLRCDYDHDYDRNENNDPSRCSYQVLEDAEGADSPCLDSDDGDAVHSQDVSVAKGTDAREQAPDILDDSLSDWFEAVRFSKELQVVFQAVCQSWQRAARKEIPLALAAFTTNAAFASLRICDDHARFLQSISNLGFQESEDVDQPVSQDDGSDTEQPAIVNATNFAKAVYDTCHILKDLKSRDHGESRGTSSPLYQPTSEYLSKCGTPSPEQEEKSASALLGSIAALYATKEHSYIVKYGTPLACDVAQYSRSKGQGGASFEVRSAVGIQLLLRGFENFLWPDGRARNIDAVPRLQALRFAQEVRESIRLVLADRTMPCRCCLTLATNLESFQNDLDAFLKERHFDLFVQSPWISGSHMLEILETSFNYSMRLCSYKHFFGSVLHLYNCLNQLGQIPIIQFLEALCKVFRDIVFPGGRPRAGYRSSFLRLKGGRLRQSQVDRSQWHLAVPKQHAREAAGFGTPREPVDSSFRYKKTSLLHSIKTKGYHIDKATWQRVQARQKDVDLEKASRSDSCPDVAARRSDKRHCRAGSSCAWHGYHGAPDMHKELEEIIAQTELVPSSSKPLPIGRINYFKLYLASVRAMAHISNAYHEEQPNGGYCICFVEDLLRRGDLCSEHESTGKGEPFGYKKLVSLCEEAFCREFGCEEQDWKHYLWEHL